MPGRLRTVLVVAVLATFLVAPALAQATLTFVRNPSNPIVLVAADNDSPLRRIALGTAPRVSPDGELIAYLTPPKGRQQYGPKNELFLIGPSGGGVRRLTRTEVDPLLLGLVPTEWSADGRRLLAEFTGQDTSYAVTVNPRTGAQRALTGSPESGFAGTALSAGGDRVLGVTGGFEPGPGHDVVWVPYDGGRPRVLVRNAFEPDWSR